VKFLITAGPTREPIDPVRFLSNRSSGKMGFTLAGTAARAGHQVVLIAGPVNLATPDGVERIDVVTADEMYQAVAARIEDTDCAIMAAAVADYRPAEIAEQKIKKADETLELRLVRTTDILGSARSPMGFTGLLVGFAAETQDLEANAAAKLEKKGCDLIVANDVSKPGIGFDSDENEVVILQRGAASIAIKQAPKAKIAAAIILMCESSKR
jgi:phosphopantothenoylcysteine decarboxylase/phosphopantothenate--cysteine ligase